MLSPAPGNIKPDFFQLPPLETSKVTHMNLSATQQWDAGTSQQEKNMRGSLRESEPSGKLS